MHPPTVRIGLLVFIIVSALAAPALAERRFVCEEIDATGFIFEAGRWEPVLFTPSKRFLVTTDGTEFRVSEFGGGDFLGDCRGHENGGNCSGILGNFIFRSDTLRFVRTYPWGFSTGDGAGDTPLVAIGKCATM